MIRIKMVKTIYENALTDLHFIEEVDFSEKRQLAEAMYEAYKHTPDYENDTIEDFEDEIDNLRGQLYGELLEPACLCVKTEDQVVGAIFVCDHKGEATMTYCFTSTAYRDRGIAQALINKAENKLKELGYTHFYLFLTLDNKVAYNLFDSLGFTETKII